MTQSDAVSNTDSDSPRRALVAALATAAGIAVAPSRIDAVAALSAVTWRTLEPELGADMFARQPADFIAALRSAADA